MLESAATGETRRIANSHINSPPNYDDGLFRFHEHLQKKSTSDGGLSHLHSQVPSLASVTAARNLCEETAVNGRRPPRT